MNYNHHFHAGNFADVIKHLLLVFTIEYNLLKGSPIVLFDSHAGNGLYDLEAHQAVRSAEYLNGIGCTHNKINKISTIYNDLIFNCNSNYQKVKYYPGSPYILASLMRKNDRLILVEKKPEFKFELEKNLRQFNYKNINFHQRDGFEALNALLPTIEKRAIILIDPAYEKLSDWEVAVESIKKLLLKLRAAQIILWYPIKDQNIVKKFYQQFDNLNNEKIFLEVTNPAIDNSKMNKCGYLIINPCFKLIEFIETMKNTIQEWEFNIIS